MPIRALGWARHPLQISCMLTIPPYSRHHPSRQQKVLSSFQNAASVLGMHISWPKTKVQNLGTGQPLSDVSVDAHHVEYVDNFTYLGMFSRQTATADLTSDVGLRLQRQ